MFTSEFDVDVLHLGVEAHGVLALFNTDTGLLPTGKGSLWEGDWVFVDRHHAAFQISCHGMGSAEVVGPNTIEQAKWRVVG